MARYRKCAVTDVERPKKKSPTSRRHPGAGLLLPCAYFPPFSALSSLWLPRLLLRRLRLLPLVLLLVVLLLLRLGLVRRKLSQLKMLPLLPLLKIAKSANLLQIWVPLLRLLQLCP